MASLPPYSTFRTDSKQMMYPQATSHGNVLTFTPPGFKQQLNVKFPDSRLAVCAKCKKNFKTRDMCRVRNTHTAAPWTTAYICITLDESCLDENGKYTEKPMTVRMVQWQPYCVKTPFDPKTPVCAACKRTNRTRSFCRERHKHRQLPWCSVYVLLSTLESADPSTIIAGPSKKVEGQEQDEKTTNGGIVKDAPPGDDSATRLKTEDGSSSIAGSDTGASEIADGDTGDDINDIADSRTFLVKVSCHACSVHWLDLADFDASEAAAAAYPVGGIPVEAQYHPGMMHPPPPMDPNHPPPPYYQPPPPHHHHMNYAAQQHQNALKSRQQYFFQMQQQHQYPPPPPPPHGHWQQPPPPPHPHYPMHPGAGGEHDADSAAAAAQQQHWAAMYYQPPPMPPYPPMPPDANGTGQQPPQAPQESTTNTTGASSPDETTQQQTQQPQQTEESYNNTQHTPNNNSNNSNEQDNDDDDDGVDEPEGKRQRVE